MRDGARQVELPQRVAIGGIAPVNAAPIIEAGADFIAVSGAVWNGDEVAAMAAFAKVLEEHRSLVGR